MKRVLRISVAAVPKAEAHILAAGHFALDTAADQIAQLVRGFMKQGETKCLKSTLIAAVLSALRP